MRELNTTELESVSGGVMQCTAEEMGTLWGINVTEHIGTAFINIYEGLIEVEKEIATLKVRCGIWGLMGGLIPAMTALMLSRT